MLSALKLSVSVLFAIAVALTALPGFGAVPDFVGTASCATCHGKQHAKWQNSHHDLAMQKATPETVLGDFNDASFTHFSVTTHFFKRDDAFVVRTDGPDGEPRDYEVAWVFGVYPLQQYLLPLDRGRLQALSVAWDSRPKDEGGQRWYHLYPNEAIEHGDPLHWTGPYQNWNTRCAECHSTDLRKNYAMDKRSFSTTFFEEDVGCEACHGPGGRHRELAEAGQLASDPLRGFAVNLSSRGEWVFPQGASIAKRRVPLENNQQIDNCGRCHARRGTLGEYRYGQTLSDTHRLSLLEAPLYHPDGQILDEVYVYGSFVQSKMHQAGVVCANCHDPHTNKLQASGNAVCAQCHKASVFDVPEHHHHEEDSAGAQCVNCHMPTQVYMGVDERRDHSMRVPRPDLSVMLGTPNACNQCHSEQKADWALTALRQWGWQRSDTTSHPALAMAAIQAGDERAVPRLLALASDGSAAPIWRATALELGASRGSEEARALAGTLLRASDPLLRISAIHALQQVDARQRYPLLLPLLEDPIRGVRFAATVALASTPMNAISEQDRNTLVAANKEFLDMQSAHADMPGIHMQTAVFHVDRGDYPAAEAAYREALFLNPQLISAYLNLADLMRSVGREDEARAWLNTALSHAPESGEVMHALGLLEARARNPEEALRWLERAAKREEQGSRHRYVYAVAQHDFGNGEAAIATLRRLHTGFPADQGILLALVNYSAENGQRDQAKRYLGKLLKIAPENRAYRQLARRLGVVGGS